MQVSKDKVAVCEKTADLRSGNLSDLNSACLKVLVPVKIFQFPDMYYETERYRDSTDEAYSGPQCRRDYMRNSAILGDIRQY